MAVGEHSNDHGACRDVYKSHGEIWRVAKQILSDPYKMTLASEMMKFADCCPWDGIRTLVIYRTQSDQTASHRTSAYSHAAVVPHDSEHTEES